MINSIIFGFISSSTLFLGAWIGVKLNVPKLLLASIMAFGSGFLISALSFDLIESALGYGGFGSVSAGFILGAVLFVAGDYLTDHLGGHNRKKGHGMSHSKKMTANGKTDIPDSGSAILLGAILDGIPESAAIGIGVAAGKGIGLSMMVAVLLSNLPEGISGAQGMKQAGKSKKFILGVWGITILLSTCAAALGYQFLGTASPKIMAVMLALAAGAILSMLSDTMIPEAFEDGGRFVALVTALGFISSFVLSHLSA